MGEAPKEQRKLAAIMFTDMVGYSGLTQRDEKLALEVLEEHRRLLRSYFPKHDGREVETTGDGFLVEFASAVLATECAIDIQKAIAAANATASPERRFQVRIGIHVGDVIHRQAQMVGDGVNIAARIEPLAEAGGICLSQTVYDQVRNNLKGVALTPLDRPQLKNIQVSIDVYRVVLPWSGRQLGPTQAVGPNVSRTRRVWPLRRVFVTTMIAVGLLGLWGWFGFPNILRRRQAAPTGSGDLAAAMMTPKIQAIAVLPLENLSGNPSQEFFADGLTEELISQLARISSIRVISRTSVMKFKHPTNSMPEIGQMLKADAVVEGSVRREGSRVRVTAQMIHAATDKPLWTDQYDREASDVLSLQGEVALAIARQIRATITPEEGARLASARRVDPKAYEAYSHGRYQHWLLTREAREKSREYYEEAIRLDPNFALAYSGLADYYTALSGATGDVPPTFTRPKAKAAALKAIELDPDLSEAHTSLAWNLMDFDFNWTEAGKQFELALKLNPNNWQAHFWHGFYLTALGKFDPAIAEFKQTRDFDPIYTLDFSWWPLLCARRTDEAAAAAERILRERPNDPWAKLALAEARLEQKRYADARELISTVDNSANTSLVKATLARAEIGLGNRATAQRILDELMAEPNAGQVRPSVSAIAMTCTALGNKDDALKWLEAAYEQRAIPYSLKVEPFWDSLRADPRFTALLRKMHLTVE